MGSTAWSGRRPRLQDVALRAGVSPATASLVLRREPGPSRPTRERVMRAAADLGYRPNRSASILARRRAHLLGVMIDVRSSFHAELVDDLHESADKFGYDLVLSTVARSRGEQRAVETLVDFRCEALILLGPDAPAARLMELSEDIPLVVVGRRLDAPGIDVVRTADDRGVGQAVDHLAGLGHQRIAFVDGGRGAIASDRRRGYRTAMRRHGLGDALQVLPGDHTEEAGTRAARWMLDSARPPTAVITFNDRCALGLLDGLNRGRLAVPLDVSVVGYDDIPSAQLAHVNLTTVRQDPQQQAQHAVAAAVERLDHGRRTPREIVLEPHLVVRGTTAAPSSAGAR